MRRCRPRSPRRSRAQPHALRRPRRRGPSARTSRLVEADRLARARETISTSSSPVEWRTPTSSSPSRILIAMIPSAFSGVLYSSNSVFLTTPFFVAKTRYFASLKSRVCDHGAHLLVLAERQQVDDRAALRLARAERQLVHLQPVDLADGGEEEDVVVRRGDEQVLDVVLVLQVHPHHADAAAALLAVRGHRQALDVARPRDRDHHVLLGDQVLELELALGGDDLGAAVVVLAVDRLRSRAAPRGSARRSAPRRRGSRGARRSAPAGRRARPRPACARGRSARGGGGRGSPAPGSRRARTAPSGRCAPRRCRRRPRISAITSSRLSSAIR